MTNTPANQTFTQLFWLDFLRYVFAPKFRRQVGITSITTFDITSPVLMSDTLDLQLPTPLETVVYYAENMEKPPIAFRINVPQILPFVVACIALLVILVFAVAINPRPTLLYRII